MALVLWCTLHNQPMESDFGLGLGRGDLPPVHDKTPFWIE